MAFIERDLAPGMERIIGTQKAEMRGSAISTASLVSLEGNMGRPNGSVTSRVTFAPALGEAKYRLGSMIVCENRNELGAFAWKNRTPISVKRNWGSLFQEDEHNIFSGVNSQRQSAVVSAEVMVEKTMDAKETGGTVRFNPMPGSLTNSPSNHLRPGVTPRPKMMVPKAKSPGGNNTIPQGNTATGGTSTVVYRLSDASEGSATHTLPISSLNVRAPAFAPRSPLAQSPSFRVSEQAQSTPMSEQSQYVSASFRNYVIQQKAAIFGFDQTWPQACEGYGQNAHYGYGGYGGHGAIQSNWNMHLPVSTTQSNVIPTFIMNQASHSGNQASPNGNQASPNGKQASVDASPQSDTSPNGLTSWTVVFVDETRETKFDESRDLKDAVHRRLTSVRIKAFKSAVKCWHSLEKKALLEKYVLIVNATEATLLGSLLLTKSFSPPMIVFGGRPEVPIPCQYCGMADVVDAVVSITGCAARDESVLEGVNFTLLWVDEQVFKAHGQARKQDLEFLKSCISVKTYKSADKSMRALSKKNVLENTAVLVSEEEADELLTYLSSRSDRVPIVVELASDSKWKQKSKYDRNLILTTSGKEETHQRLPEFVFRVISTK